MEHLLALMRFQLEQRFPPYHLIGNYAFAPTGQPYQKFAISGRAVQLELLLNTLYRSIIAAYKEGGTLYWRTLPEGEPRDGGFSIYCRLLVSDQPVVLPPNPLPNLP